MSLLGKMFLTAAGAWIQGRPTHLKVRGTPREVQSVERVMRATKAVHDELRKPCATVQTVMDALDGKRAAAEDFKAVFGIPWPL